VSQVLVLSVSVSVVVDSSESLSEAEEIPAALEVTPSAEEDSVEVPEEDSSITLATLLDESTSFALVPESEEEHAAKKAKADAAQTHLREDIFCFIITSRF